MCCYNNSKILDRYKTTKWFYIIFRLYSTKYLIYSWHRIFILQIFEKFSVSSSFFFWFILFTAQHIVRGVYNSGGFQFHIRARKFSVYFVSLLVYINGRNDHITNTPQKKNDWKLKKDKKIHFPMKKIIFQFSTIFPLYFLYENYIPVNPLNIFLPVCDLLFRYSV